MKCEAIWKYRMEFRIREMCSALGIGRSTYYSWVKTKLRNEEKLQVKVAFIQSVRNVFEANRCVYGYRKMQHALKAEGITLSIYRLRKIMRENGMYPQLVKRFKPYSNAKPIHRFSDNVVNQQFRTKRFNEVWAGDITYIKTKLGWVYLAVVMELYNREIIGYAVSKEMNAELVRRALGQAIARSGGGENVIFHSDRGVQYCSESFQKMLQSNSMVSSMSRSGCPYDNSCVEGFFATLKKECMHKKDFITMDEVEQDLFAYIELFYNRQRLHRTLGYLSPVQYRMKVGEIKPA